MRAVHGSGRAGLAPSRAGSSRACARATFQPRWQRPGILHKHDSSVLQVAKASLKPGIAQWVDPSVPLISETSGVCTSEIIARATHKTLEEVGRAPRG